MPLPESLRLKWIQLVLGMIFMLVGLLSALAWVFGPQFLIFTAAPNEPEISLGFLACGLIFVLDARGKRRPIPWLSAGLLGIFLTISAIVYLWPGMVQALYDWALPEDHSAPLPTQYSSLFMVIQSAFFLLYLPSTHRRPSRLAAMGCLVTNIALVTAVFLGFTVDIKRTAGFVDFLEVSALDNGLFALLCATSFIMLRRQLGEAPSLGIMQKAIVASYGVGMVVLTVLFTSDAANREKALLADPEAIAALTDSMQRILALMGLTGVIMTWIMVTKAGLAHKRELEAKELNARLEWEVVQRRKISRDMKRANEELTRSNRDLQEFAQVASHDLQEPLRKIHAFSNRITDNYSDALDDKGRDYLMRMNRSVDRMAVLIDDLLNFARVQTRARELKPVHLRPVIVGVLEEMSEKIEETGATVSMEGDFPDVMADESQLRQVFQNLISNALKFSREEAAPQICITGRQVDKRLELEVSDNGIGIEKEYLEKIFNVFQRLHGRLQYPGTGIGLAIVKRIIERHGSEVTVKSEPDEGSAFTFSLKLSP